MVIMIKPGLRTVTSMNRITTTGDERDEPTYLARTVVAKKQGPTNKYILEQVQFHYRYHILLTLLSSLRQAWFSDAYFQVFI